MKGGLSTVARTFSTRTRSRSRMLAMLLVVGLLLGQPGGFLTLGAGPGTAHAAVLAGADSATLVRAQPQTPDGLGAAGLNGLQLALQYDSAVPYSLVLTHI
jgi:hypothetical protein